MKLLAVSKWLCLTLLLRGVVLADGTNSWTNNAGGLWRDSANWSSNQAPDITFSHVLITNGNSKTVTIDSLTSAANLSISNLVLAAPTGATNTLVLVDVTTNLPLQLWRTLTIDRGGDLQITNSALSFNGSAGSAFFDLAAGNASLRSGAILCNGKTLRVGRNNGAEGRLSVQGGTMLAGAVQLGSATGSQGILELGGGLFLSSSVFTVGFSPGATGVVSLTSGALIATNDLSYIGQSGFGQMIQNGGSFTFASLTVGNNADGSYSLNNGLLTILPRTTNDLFRIGNLGTGILEISGGTNFVLSEFHLADSDSSVGTVLVSGGKLIATNDLTAIGRQGIGQMIISAGGTAQLTNTSVGRHSGSFGYIELQTNGTLSMVDDLSIGRFSNSVGSVFIDGGSALIPNDTVWVGREGAGDLTVASGTLQAESLFVGVSTDPTNMPSGNVSLDGGQTRITSELSIGTQLYSTGQVEVAGGLLLVTNNSGSATLRVANGTFTVSSGSVVVDRLLITNTSGQFNFTAGTVQAKQITASNGAPIVIGDGVQPALLKLLGGPYSFADGLVISSNATLEVCGTILGNITNHGSLITNCAPTIAFTAIQKVGNSVSLSFSTISNRTHVLEYKNQLNETNWTAAVSPFLGDGTVMTKIDPAASAPSRFYRLRTQ